MNHGETLPEKNKMTTHKKKQIARFIQRALTWNLALDWKSFTFTSSLMGHLRERNEYLTATIR